MQILIREIWVWAWNPIQLALLHICGFYILRIQLTKDEKKILGTSKLQNLNLTCAGHYFHSIYILLGITSNLEMI